MEKAELNRDVKKLFKEVFTAIKGDADVYFKKTEGFKKELNRLYYADVTMDSLSKENVLRLLRLNVLLRVIPFHYFGLQTNDEKLLK